MLCEIDNEHGACQLEGEHEPIMCWAVKWYVGWKIPGPVKGRIIMAFMGTVHE